MLEPTNVGSAGSTGQITVTDTLPQGIKTAGTPTTSEEFEWTCTPGAGNSVVTCTISAPVSPLTPAGPIFVPVTLEPGATEEPNKVTVSGGGAPAEATASSATLLGLPRTPFGAIDFTASALNADGTLDTQAGDHPAALTTAFAFPSRAFVGVDGPAPEPVENVRQMVIDLPAGVVGNPQVTPKCALSDLSNFGACAPATRVGTLALIEPGRVRNELSIYNVVPERGHPAEFGVFEPGVMRAELLYASVRTGSDYGLRVVSAPNDQFVRINGVVATFFGNPAVLDHSGNASRAFFSNPTDCGPSFTTAIHVDSWPHPGRFNADGSPDFTDPNWKGATAQSPPVSGCQALRFNPEIEIAPAEPDVALADSPTGLRVDLRVPQSEDPSNLATPELKDAVVKLPVGVAVSPSAANGLEACTPADIGLSNATAPSCPDASKIGSVEIVTPALTEPLKGAVYIAQQNANPFGSLLAIYLVAEGSGVVIKLAGHVEADPVTGQLTTRFEGNPPSEGLPQQQFSDLKLNFFGGPRAALAAPPRCGTYETQSSLTPWSGKAPSESLSSFAVASGCAVGGFAPVFTAGTGNNQAGGYSAGSTTFSRRDGEQRFGGVQLQLPPGLLGKIAGIPQCPEAQANAGTCSAASQIGTTTAAAGPGTSPIYVPQPGQPPNPVYLTGPYHGAPFGLSIVTHAAAGPFDLGNVVVRAAITVDPQTTQITALTDSSGAHAIPTILQGIPLDLRTINVTVDRPAFVFNPTNCEALAVHGMIAAAGGASTAVSTPFRAANCASLRFKPAFSATTAGNGGFHGASLDVKIAQTPGEAAIHKVDVQLPLALPSRLVTLQKACTETQFAANPAGCPPGSAVGLATALTPVLNVPLTGPAYLVSHGGAAFPDLDIVLQGEGVTIVLTGNTDIKKGITFSRFETVPDAPITSFELNLPGGPGAVLAAIRNLCAPTKTVTVRKPVTRRVHGRVLHEVKTVKRVVPEPLVMPTTITGQNGAVVHQATQIAATGCHKARKVTVRPKPRRSTKHPRRAGKHR